MSLARQIVQKAISSAIKKNRKVSFHLDKNKIIEYVLDHSNPMKKAKPEQGKTLIFWKPDEEKKDGKGEERDVQATILVGVPNVLVDLGEVVRRGGQGLGSHVGGALKLLINNSGSSCHSDGRV